MSELDRVNLEIASVVDTLIACHRDETPRWVTRLQNLWAKRKKILGEGE